MMLTVLTQNAQLGQVAKRACASLLPCGRRRFSKKKSDHVAEFHLLKRLLRHEISEGACSGALLLVGKRRSGGDPPFHHGFLRRFVEMDFGVHVIDPFERNEMRQATGVRIVLGQYDLLGTFLMVDRADVLTI